MQDRIVKKVELAAPVARVWKALTDYKEFGEWFRVNLDGPFALGEVSTGQMTYPGCEHMKWRTTVTAMEPERLFAFTWCPDEGNPEVDASEDVTVLVEFELEETPSGSLLVITESGFDALPDKRRIDAMRENTRGWDEQAKNIAAHVES